MLKGLSPLIGPDLLKILGSMAAGDEIAIVDGNYPADAHATRLVRMDGHDAVSVADAVLSLLPLDTSTEAAAFRPGIAGAPNRREPIFADFEGLVARHSPGHQVVPLHGADFYARVRGSYALIATSERRLYGNLILRKGTIAQ